MKRLIGAWIALGLLLMMLFTGMAEGTYQTLRQGDQGKNVLALKQRMYELGYFSSTKFSDEFNAVTKERLMELQRKNGLTADGIATADVQALIFSDACLPRSAPEATRAPVEAQGEEKTSALAQPTFSGEIAEMDFLPAGQEPQMSANRKEGVWTYISQSLHIEIRRHAGTSPWGANQWLEASVRLKNPEQLCSLLSPGKKPGVTLTTPAKIIESSGRQPILAFNDDFFGYRHRYGGKIGVIVRDGKILYDEPKKSGAKGFPPLDVLAVFENGTMKTFPSDAYRAKDYLDMGVRHTFSFGPILVREGEVWPDAAKWGTGRAPRMAVGITADGVIKVLDVLGRRTDAKGVSVAWVADKMKEIGCVEALNLDGGNTTCLIFMGDMINRPEKTALKDIRRVTGLIAIEEAAP